MGLFVRLPWQPTSLSLWEIPWKGLSNTWCQKNSSCALSFFPYLINPTFSVIWLPKPRCLRAYRERLVPSHLSERGSGISALTWAFWAATQAMLWLSQEVFLRVCRQPKVLFSCVSLSQWALFLAYMQEGHLWLRHQGF